MVTHYNVRIRCEMPYLHLLLAVLVLLQLVWPPRAHQALSHNLTQSHRSAYGEGVKCRRGPSCIEKCSNMQKHCLTVDCINGRNDQSQPAWLYCTEGRLLVSERQKSLCSGTGSVNKLGMQGRQSHTQQ